MVEDIRLASWSRSGIIILARPSKSLYVSRTGYTKEDGRKIGRLAESLCWTLNSGQDQDGGGIKRRLRTGDRMTSSGDRRTSSG